jgi:hypothetical protein
MNAGSDRHFVAKYQRAIDEADLLEAHGSGRYLLMLNDARARKTIDRATVTVYNDQAPLRVRPEPIIAVPENEPWRHWVEEVQAAKLSRQWRWKSSQRRRPRPPPAKPSTNSPSCRRNYWSGGRAMRWAKCKPPLQRPASMFHPPAGTVNHRLPRGGEFSTGRMENF